MDNTIDKQPITPESVLESVREMFVISRAEFDQRLEKSSAEFDRRAAEFDQRLEKSRADADRRAAEFDQRLEKSRAEADLRAAKADEESKALREKIEKLGVIVKQTTKQLGGMCNSNGDAAQEFFYNSLSRKKVLFGEKFDLVIEQESRKSIVGFEAEYDIIMFNGRYVCIIEVKYKADVKNIQKVLRKITTFRKNFPEHNDKKIYLALAGMSFNKNTVEACKDNGIAIIKQVGDTIEVYDENLKTF